MYDAIVVGARCAGSPTAMLLARKGYRVLLVDRGSFPSDTLSTHFIWPPGVARLARWGLLGKVQASNCPAIQKITFDVGHFALRGALPSINGIAECFCPRRKVLDKILLDAAVEAGAEVRERFPVQEIVMDGDRVAGIRGQPRGGGTVTEKARIVIGADGRRSLIARAVEAPEYNVRPTFGCFYYSYWSGVALEGAEVNPRDGRAIIAAPTNDGLTIVIVPWVRRDYYAYRADIEGNFLRTLELAPGLAERVRQGRREDQFYGTGDVPNFFRRRSGNGWALAGDAGYHKDPMTAQGITDAFRDAELLTRAIDDGFSRRRSLEDALANFEHRRNREVMPMYELTCQLAAMEPPTPEMARLHAALQGNQTEINRFLGTVAGTVPIAEFYSPENVGRILAEAPETAVGWGS